MKKNNKKAFTLVELLVVIAIIAILAVVSVVGYTAFTKKAKESVAQQELAQVVNLIIAEDVSNDAYDIDGTNGIVFTGEKKTTVTINDLLPSADYSEDLSQLNNQFDFKTSEVDGKTAVTAISYTAKDGGVASYDFTTKKYSNVKAA